MKEISLRLLPQDAYNEQSLRACLERDHGLHAAAVRVLRRSIDARQRTIYVNLTLRIYEAGEPVEAPFQPITYPDVSLRPTVIVVGAGPGGLFAALRLIELGLRPLVVERGKDVHERKKDLARIRIEQQVSPESNYAFGEGGAGAYSDGKLFTRSKKRGDVEKILRIFVQHGASPAILADAHPHIGTDRLPRVIEHMRQTIIGNGGEVRFETRMTSLIRRGNRVEGIQADTPQGPVELRGEGVILATGHSARDVYRHLLATHVEMEPKGIAVGVRLEHPAELIDRIQYHNRQGRGRWLPAAEYSLVEQVEGRGVYSFCMCPGGFVIPAATGPEQIVVNGMSPSHRNGRWSNSGMVVEVRPEDIGPEAAGRTEAVMEFQEELERQCWLQGNRRQTAPAQRMADFVEGRLSSQLAPSSYAPGLLSSPLHFWMPSSVSHRLQQAFRVWGRRMHGFLTNEATVIGVETRTSSPLRILREADTLQHPTLERLFPCGEGAGYAGGIVSAAVDGERCAEACAACLGVE